MLGAVRIKKVISLPYVAPDFVQLCQSYLYKQNLPKMEDTSQQIRGVLTEHDYEYMVCRNGRKA